MKDSEGIFEFVITNVSDKTFDKVVQVQDEAQLNILVNHLDKACELSATKMANAYNLGMRKGIFWGVAACAIGAGLAIAVSLTSKKLKGNKQK